MKLAIICILYTLTFRALGLAAASAFGTNARASCIQDTLSSRAALGLPSASREQRYLAYKRASKSILHTRVGWSTMSDVYLARTSLNNVWRVSSIDGVRVRNRVKLRVRVYRVRVSKS